MRGWMAIAAAAAVGMAAVPMMAAGCDGDDAAAGSGAGAGAGDNKKARAPFEVEIVKVDASDPHRLKVDAKVSAKRYAFSVTAEPKPRLLSQGKDLIAHYTLPVGKLAEGKHQIAMVFRHKDGRSVTRTVDYERRPTLKVASLHNIVCTLRKCRASVRDGQLRVTAPEGTEIAYEQTTPPFAQKVVSKGQEVTLELGLLGDALAAGRAVLRDARKTKKARWGKGPSAVKRTLRLTFADGVSVSAELHMGTEVLGGALFGTLRDAAKGRAVAFPGEPPAPARPRSVALLNRSTVLGPASSAHEIDLVADLDVVDKTRNCGKFTNTKTGAVKRFGFKVYDWKAVVYDRRTGKRVAAKTFKGSRPKCPKRVTGGLPNGRQPSHGEYLAWLEGLLSK